MTTNWTEAQAQTALREVMQRASEDAAFRQLCLSSPAEAVKAVTGHGLPEGFTLRFVDNNEADLTVVLPDMAVQQELSDADLEVVAGGANKTCMITADYSRSDVFKEPK